MATAELIQAIAATAELCGAKLSEAAARMLVRDLSAYPEQRVMAALTKVRKSGKRFSLGVIIEEIEQGDGRPGPDAAWAMLPRSEDDTCVWTPEMQTAWGIARPLLEDGDKFGARRAFVEEYERRVDEARENGIPVRWEVSLGQDQNGREAVVRDAVTRGLIPASQMQTLLPSPDMTQSPIAQIAFGSAKQIGHESTPADREKVAEMLRKLKQELGSIKNLSTREGR
ncbi:MAG TPA: hypothetical protein VJ652_14945 [Noviherbaspirillum sp.]|nr:hypothetical protein [Noviherbaspirillum sp.]